MEIKGKEGRDRMGGKGGWHTVRDTQVQNNHTYFWRVLVSLGRNLGRNLGRSLGIGVAITLWSIGWGLGWSGIHMGTPIAWAMERADLWEIAGVSLAVDVPSLFTPILAPTEHTGDDANHNDLAGLDLADLDLADLPHLADRLAAIREGMKKVRFCVNQDCLYYNLRSQIVPPNRPDAPYTATITAAIARPSANPDSADYHFEFRDHRWVLVRAEEYADGSDVVFIGDRYEVTNSISRRYVRGTLAKARQAGVLGAGYLALYYDVLDQGKERLPLQ